MTDALIFLPLVLLIIGAFVTRTYERKVLLPRWSDRARNINETVEFKLSIEGQCTYLLFILLLILCATYSRQLGALLSEIFAASAGLLTILLFRYASWSPIYKGASLVAAPEGISGGGGIGKKPWFISWPEIERVEMAKVKGSGRIAIFKKGAPAWSESFEQGGPFGVSSYEIVINYLASRAGFQTNVPRRAYMALNTDARR